MYKRTIIFSLFIFLVVVVSLFLLYKTLTAPVEVFYVGELLVSIRATIWASIGLSLSMGLSILGSAYGIFSIGSSIMGAGVRTPRVRSKNLISILLCEALSIFGIVFVIFVNNTAIKQVTDDSIASFQKAFSVFWAGLSIGMTNLICGIAIGILGSSAVLVDAHNSTLFFRIMVIEIFASSSSLFALIVGILQTF